LSGLGIYLGRFLELNSWDLFFHPRVIMLDIINRLIHPVQNEQAYGVTLMFGAFLFMCYLTFISVQNHGRATRAGFRKGIMSGEQVRAGSSKADNSME
jgi:uncharacterized membrane protein